MNQFAKRWGRVTAKPSEYLVKLRRGKVVEHGPGLSTRLWPGDTFAILPTSIQRTSFVADQVTAEKVGVSITGIAVFRIAQPLLAFRMLDFEAGADGVEQLAAILREMFIGAARRLVANMTVHQCMTQRKESIAHELLREISPVVSGSGREEDTTDGGWGVVLDTIEIQDVRVLSELVFADLQAPYRAELALEARKSAVVRDQEIHLREVAAKHKVLEVDQGLAGREAETMEQRRLQDLACQERVDQAEAELALHRASRQANLAQLEREQQLALSEMEPPIARQEVESERLRAEHRLWLQGRERALQNSYTDERLRYEFITNALPTLAQAFVEGLGDVRQTRFVTDRSDGAPSLLIETVAQLLEVARASGLELFGDDVPDSARER
jgi:flotillin